MSFKYDANRHSRDNPLKSFELQMTTRKGVHARILIGGRHSPFGESIRVE